MLIDSFGRRVNYLRVSVTERCNFRCLYCMPDKPFNWVSKENILSYEELFSIIKVAIDEGVIKIRITGGEPTLREDLDKFIKMVYDYSPNIDLALTTNGFLLAKYAKKYKESGLNRVNISLDSLKPDIAMILAKKDVLNEILAGIDEALMVGLKVKLNMVPIIGLNSDEVLDILEFGRDKKITVRFIEFMENSFAPNLKGINSKDILETISTKYSFVESESLPNSPSKYYKLDDGYEFGVIEPHRDDFCKSCNRLRLSAEGDLIPCLYFDEAKSLKDVVKSGNVAKIEEILFDVVKNKPEKNRWSDDLVSQRAFYHTGG